MTNYPHRYTLVVEAASKHAVDAFLSYVNREAREYLTQSYSPTGRLPVTHYLLSTHATEAQRQKLEIAENEELLPAGLMYFRQDAITNEVLLTNHPDFVIDDENPEVIFPNEIAIRLGLQPVAESE